MFDFLVARKEGKGRDMGDNGGEDGEGGIGMIASEKGMGAPPQKKGQTYLALDMPKIHPQLLHQRRFPIIPLRPKRSQPACP